MNKFKDVQFDVSTKLNNNEAGSLLTQIESALTDAGWNQVDWKGGDLVHTRPNRPKTGTNAGIGVVVNVKPSDEAVYLIPATTLSDELNKAGISATVELAELAESIPNMNPKTIHIFVGEKPP